MEKTDKRYQAYIDILREELIPAMGCTEPIAVAYAAAAARNTLGELPDKVLVEASGSMIKNVKSVIVPNTDNMKGLEAAAAAGIVAGKQEKKLEVIADVTPEQTKAIRAYLDQTDIKVQHVENGVTFDIILTVWKGEHSAQVRIAVFHTNIVHVEKDGEVLVDIPVHGDNEETLTDRSLLDMEHIWDFANTVDVEDVRSILEPQIRCNMAIAEEGLRGNYGANIGSVLLDMEGNDVRVRAKAYAAAGSDARMNGCEQPVVINSGSGNQGITTSVPVIVYAQELGVSDEKLLRALTLSNLTTIEYIRNAMKRVRKKNSAVLLASQNIDDFLAPDVREYTKPLFAIPANRFLFYPGHVEQRDFCDALSISSAEYALIDHPERGVCLYHCGNARYLLQVQAPDFQAMLFGDAGGR